jgi:hypothetical protein
MQPNQLEVTGFDSFSGHDFIVYFSDQTYATITAADLAACFSERMPIPDPDED